MTITYSMVTEDPVMSDFRKPFTVRPDWAIDFLKGLGDKSNYKRKFGDFWGMSKKT